MHIVTGTYLPKCQKEKTYLSFSVSLAETSFIVPISITLGEKVRISHGRFNFILLLHLRTNS